MGALHTEAFAIAPEDARSADALGLIAELSAELARRYDHVDDGSAHFRPEDVAVRGVFLIGRVAGRAVACGAVRPMEGDIGEVKRMYVQPAMRGRGLSKGLLAALEDAARKMGYVALRMETAERQTEAIGLYRSAGYRRIEPFGDYVASRRSICFEKRLSESPNKTCADSTRRFSDRVSDYIKYRPGYPQALIADLSSAGVLTCSSIVADIGSGTGLLTRLFLENRNRVFGVEPNAEMRAAGEQQLAGYRLFTSIDGRAEATTLPGASVDLLAAGQAFHWFDRERAKDEFRRILRAPGWVVLVWNERKTDSTPFLGAYERLLQTYATDYTAVDHRRVTDNVIGEFFHPCPFNLRTYENQQVFDWEGLCGRLLSSSYAPPPGHPQHTSMMDALAKMFQNHQRNGSVTFDYKTRVYTARLLRVDD